MVILSLQLGCCGLSFLLMVIQLQFLKFLKPESSRDLLSSAALHFVLLLL